MSRSDDINRMEEAYHRAYGVPMPPLIAGRMCDTSEEPPREEVDLTESQCHAGVIPPSVSGLTAAFDAARKRVEAQQPTQADLAAATVRCHVADALSSLCDALVMCEEMDDVQHLVNGLDTLKNVQLRLRKTQRNCESGNITT